MRMHPIHWLLLAGLLATTAAFGQNRNVKGIWKGVIPTPASDVELYWRIDLVTSDSLAVFHDCPIYGVKDVPAPKSWAHKGRILLEVERFPSMFFGQFTSDPDSIAGLYKGEGVGIPLGIRRISGDPGLLLPFMAPRVDAEGAMASSWEYIIPEDRDDGWQTGEAERAGLDSGLLEDLMENAIGERYTNLHSILIARGGKLVFEEYFYDHQVDKPHPIYSNTKGIISLGVGIAMDEGFVPEISTPLRELFPDYATSFEGDRRGEITLEHLLTMTAGYEWDETSASYYDPGNTNRQMMNSDDFVEFVLSRPLAHQPGEQYTYNSGLPVVLSEIVRRGTGESFWEYASARLFPQLGFENYLYSSNRDGTAGGLLLRPRDFLKVPRFYLDGGLWQGEQILPEGWLERSTQPEWAPGRPPYWNHWGRSTIFVKGVPVTRYSGGGFGGQAIFGFPDLDLVVAFTAGNYTTPSVNYDDLLSRYILPPLVEEGSEYVPPVRAPEMELEGYTYRETFFTGLACLWSALGQLGHDVSEAWVYGIAGTAFALNANEQMWPSCAGRWSNPRLSDQLALLGCTYETLEAYHLQPSFADVRREAWSAVRTAIDGGVPAWGFHMHIPENYLIYGYDSHGYYFRGDDCPGGFGPKSWEAVATDEPGWFEMHTLAPASPAPVEEAVFAALEYAIAMRDSSETFRHGGFVFGHDAYGQWQRTLSADEADWMGIAYNARAWSVARRNAERFLGEVEEYVPGSCSEALGRAQEEFEAVARSWEEVSDLFPYDDTERWERIANWQDDERRESARRLLSNAAKAEVRGTAWIEKVLELWDSAGGDGE